MRPIVRPSALSGELGANIELRTGNVQFIDIGAQGRIDIEDSLWLAFFVGKFQIRSQSRYMFDRSGFFHLRYNRTIFPELVFELFSQQEYNQSIRLKNRALIGSGFRVPVFWSEATHLAIGTSWMYEYEERTTSTNAEETPFKRVHRWNNYIVCRYGGIPHIVVANTLYIQPRFDVWADVRLLDEGLVVLEISKAFSITNSLTYRFDNIPPSGVQSSDLSLKTGILFSF